MKYGSVDRIEGNYAVIVFDDRTTMNYPCNGLKEGDRILFKDNHVSKVLNNDRKKRNIFLQNLLFKKNKEEKNEN